MLQHFQPKSVQSREIDILQLYSERDIYMVVNTRGSVAVYIQGCLPDGSKGIITHLT